MKKIIFLFAIAFIASFTLLNAQTIVLQDHDLAITNLEKPAPLPVLTTKGDIELKHISGVVGTYLGSTGVSGTFYCSGCISFTAGQIERYVGGVLSAIKVYVPSESRLPNLNAAFSRVWIKGSLDGDVIYEQTFSAKYDQWNEISLTNPHTITAGTFVIGYTLLVENLNTAELRPWGMSRNTDDIYKPGGVNYVRNASPDNYKAGATWSTYMQAGNLGIIGVVSGIVLPDKDLSALSVVYPNPSEYKLVNQEYPYSVFISNEGGVAQKDFTVQIIDDNDNVLAEKLITEEIQPFAAPTEVAFSITFPLSLEVHLRGKVVLEGDVQPANNISLPSVVIIYPQPPLAYCAQTVFNAYGWETGPHEVNCAVGFPASNEYVGKLITGVAYGMRNADAIQEFFTAWVKNDLNDEYCLWQDPYIEAVTGWQLYTIDPPILLGYEDIYFGYRQEVIGYNMSYHNNDYNFNGWYYRYGGNDWVNRNDPDGGNFLGVGNLCIVGVIKDNVCDPVSNLTVTYTDDCEAIVEWTASPNAKSYNIYRDGTILVASNVTETTYIDKDFNYSIGHMWYVSAVNDQGESVYKWVQKSKCQPVAVNDMVNQIFTIFPNPSSTSITIKAESNFSKVEVFNFLGQITLSQPNADKMMKLDISHLNAGVYFVRITTDNGVAVKKFVKQ